MGTKRTVIQVNTRPSQFEITDVCGHLRKEEQGVLFSAWRNGRTLIAFSIGMLTFMAFGLIFLLSVRSEGFSSATPVILPAIMILAGLMAGFLAFIRRR